MKHLKKIGFFLLVFLGVLGFAQNMNIEWGTSVGGIYYDYSESVAVDNDGYVYTVGSYKGEVDFDPGTDSLMLTAGWESTDMYIQKLDAEGNLIWIKSIGGDGSEHPMDITVDNSGDLLITGVFANTVDFDPGPDTFELVGGGYNRMFVLKLNSDGAFIWAKNLETTDGNGPTYSIQTDDDNNVYVAGRFSNSIDFDPGVGTTIIGSTNNSADAFVLKLDENGDFNWVSTVAGAGLNYAYDLVVGTDKSVYVTGSFAGTSDFDQSAGVFNMTSINGDDIYLMKLDENGNFQWAKSIGGNSIDRGIGLTLDINDNLFLIGYYSNTVDFQTDQGTYTSTAEGSWDIFVQKVSANGDFAWVKCLGSVNTEKATDIIWQDDKLIITGWFQGTFDLDPGVGVFNVVSNGSNDIFLLLLDDNGNFINGESIGSIGSDQCYGVAMSQWGEIYLSGEFLSELEVSGEDGMFTIENHGNADGFLIKLNQHALDLDNNDIMHYEIYPNPSSEGWKIDLNSSSEYSIRMYNLEGNLIYQESGIQQAIYDLDLVISSGVYFLDIVNAGSSYQHKLIKL